jgi:hypothetical protein
LNISLLSPSMYMGNPPGWGRLAKNKKPPNLYFKVEGMNACFAETSSKKGFLFYSR